MSKEVAPIMFGGHMHYLGQELCVTCEEENAAFMRLQAALGAVELERRLLKLRVVKEYYQHYHFDPHSPMNEFDGAYVERGRSVFSDADDVSLEEQLADEQAAEELLEPLDAREKHIMRRTSEGFKPKEIAIELGHANSNMIRLGKYEAKRKLGVPIKSNMRRKKK